MSHNSTETEIRPYCLHSLPKEILENISYHVAKLDAESLLNLHCTCRYVFSVSGRKDCVAQCLVASTGDPDDALCIAAKHGDKHIVELLCERYGANPNEYYGDALTLSAMNGHTDVVEILCERFGADARNGVALMWAAKNGHDGIVKMLCRRFDIDVIDFNDVSMSL